jgi:hypothetical protein
VLWLGPGTRGCRAAADTPSRRARGACRPAERIWSRRCFAEAASTVRSVRSPCIRVLCAVLRRRRAVGDAKSLCTPQARI